MKTIQILLVDDHQVVRDGLQRMLEQEEDLKIVGQSSNSDETMSRIDELAPDIVLMDIKMPGMDGIELTRQVKKRHPSCNIIMLTLYDQYMTQAMEAGARGYLLKDIKRRELAQAIRQVYYGQIVTSESFRAKMNADYDDSRRMTGRGDTFGNPVENAHSAPYVPGDTRPAANVSEPTEFKGQGITQTLKQVHHESRHVEMASESFKSTVKVDYQGAQCEADFSGVSVDEIQVVLPPPVEAGQLMKLADRIEESLNSRVLKMVGAWQEGTVMSIVLTGALPMGDILKTLRSMPEIEAAGETPVTETVDQALLAKAEAIPTLSGTRKTIFLSLAKKEN